MASLRGVGLRELINGANGGALLSKSAAARLLGLSPRTIDAMIDAGQLQVRTVAGLQRPKVTRQSIDQYLDKPQAQRSPQEAIAAFRRRALEFAERGAHDAGN